MKGFYSAFPVTLRLLCPGRIWNVVMVVLMQLLIFTSLKLILRNATFMPRQLLCQNGRDYYGRLRVQLTKHAKFFKRISIGTWIVDLSGSIISCLNWINLQMQRLNQNNMLGLNKFPMTFDERVIYLRSPSKI